MIQSDPSYETPIPATEQERRASLGEAVRHYKLSERLKEIVNARLEALNSQDGSMSDTEFTERFRIDEYADKQREAEVLEKTSSEINLTPQLYRRTLSSMQTLNRWISDFDHTLPQWAGTSPFGNLEDARTPARTPATWVESETPGLLALPSVPYNEAYAASRNLMVLAGKAYMQARMEFQKINSMVNSMPGGPEEALLQRHEQLRREYRDKTNRYARAWIAYVAEAVPELLPRIQEILDPFRKRVDMSSKQLYTEPLSEDVRREPERQPTNNTFGRVAAAAGIVAAAGVVDVARQMPDPLAPEPANPEQYATSPSPEQALEQALADNGVIIEDAYTPPVEDIPAEAPLAEAPLEVEAPATTEPAEETPAIDPYALYQEQGGGEDVATVEPENAEEASDEVTEAEDPLASGLY